MGGVNSELSQLSQDCLSPIRKLRVIIAQHGVFVKVLQS